MKKGIVEKLITNETKGIVWFAAVVGGEETFDKTNKLYRKEKEGEVVLISEKAYNTIEPGWTIEW